MELIASYIIIYKVNNKVDELTEKTRQLKSLFEAHEKKLNDCVKKLGEHSRCLVLDVCDVKNIPINIKKSVELFDENRTFV